MSERLLGYLDEVWSSIEDLCATLTPQEWATPTDLPGWDVKDQLSHICGIESALLGRPQPKPLAKPWPDHVHNDIGAMNEAQILERRSAPGEEVLVEFLELTAERLKVLSELTDSDWNAEAKGVLGVAPMHDIVAIRVVDNFFHEQDMRRAVGKPGHLEGVVAAAVVQRMARALPMIAGKRAKLPDGTTLVIDVTGPAGVTIALEIKDGWAETLERIPKKPTTKMKMDVETFLCGTGGRWNAERISKNVIVDGLANVANNIVASMNVMM
ncbi:MAG: maleylpyruvate isomerase family mycothiol-dependent enzyme [Actinomycetota bacterium]